MRTRLLLIALACSPSVAGCCCSDDYLNLSVNHTTPRWGETMRSGPEPYLVASYAEENWPAGEVFELYDGDEQIPLMMTKIPWEANSDKAGSCEVTKQEYAVEQPLAEGSYTLVHRKANGNDDDINCFGDCPWTEFDDEEALTLTLHVGPGGLGGGGGGGMGAGGAGGAGGMTGGTGGMTGGTGGMAGGAGGMTGGMGGMTGGMGGMMGGAGGT